MKTLRREMAWTILLFVLLVVPLRADKETKQPLLTVEHQKDVREKSLSLLRDIAPASSSGRTLKTMVINGALVYWGNLFDPNQVMALVNLAPEKPQLVDGDWDGNFPECWPYYLSLCVWEKNHWVYRQYIDNARSLTFHDRKDSPSHFVQAYRKTGRYEGDFLSWYYEPKTGTLVRTNYESWGPFYLIGDFLCTTRGFEHRAYFTVWIYPYNEGKKGDLLAIYDSDMGRGELRNFSISFCDHQTKKLWTYSFSPDEEQPPYLNYTVDAVEGERDEKAESPARHHYSAKMNLSAGEPIDAFCFERLTRLSYALVNAGIIWDQDDWSDVVPKTPPIKQVNYQVTGDPEIVRHLRNP